MIYEFFAEELAPWFYNKGLADGRGRIEQLLAGIGEDLEAWERFPPLAGKQKNSGKSD